MKNTFYPPSMSKLKIRNAVLSALLMLSASAVMAQPDFRVCGLLSKTSFHPAQNVGFVMKVQKNDRKRCSEALDQALEGFNKTGGTANPQGLNRIWRRVKGGNSGPFQGARKGVYSQSLYLMTCEDFVWHTTGQSPISKIGDGRISIEVRDKGVPDRCYEMQPNQLYTLAAEYGQFSIR